MLVFLYKNYNCFFLALSALIVKVKYKKLELSSFVKIYAFFITAFYQLIQFVHIIRKL